MATKTLPTSIKIANLEKVKSQRMARIEEEHAAQLSSLLTKRKEEIFNIFLSHSATNIDDQLLIGFIKFINDIENKHHPIINDFLKLTAKPNTKKK